MSDVIYYIDEEEVNADTFREEEERQDAEDYLVSTYREAIGDIQCQEHQKPASYALHFESKTGECRIKTVACCPAFDHSMNVALMTQFTADVE
ncbi:hypothetical protein [Hahella ganghwensis]|uniref:hypothetical protein n=1 Tax=Hahella ganghwensis TaxID=286420 RepID=UPI00036F498D|nr:hypothetical protein [Hahella ganghwensis]